MHLFVIPDANRRWDEKNKLPKGKEHLAGYEAFKTLLESVWDLGVTHFTFWGLSIANFAREKEEVACLKALLHTAIDELWQRTERPCWDIKFRVVGDIAFRLPWRLCQKIEDLEARTKHHDKKHLTLLLAYDGEWDLDVRDTQMRLTLPPLIEPSRATKRKLLPSGFLPDVDLMVRTGGEPHLSGAPLAIQMANAHIHFSDTYWPDFSVKELEEAIRIFKSRPRRFGK